MTLYLDRNMKFSFESGHPVERLKLMSYCNMMCGGLSLEIRWKVQTPCVWMGLIIYVVK